MLRAWLGGLHLVGLDEWSPAAYLWTLKGSRPSLPGREEVALSSVNPELRGKMSGRGWDNVFGLFQVEHCVMWSAN